jgi:hypothetical protein
MIKQKNLKLIYRRCVYVIMCSLVAIPLPVTAQATPDGTLPTTVEQLEETNAAEMLSLSGTSPDGEISSAIRSETLQTGNKKSANINISTQQLKLRDQGQIQAGSFSDDIDGLGGDIIIDVSELIDLNTGIISASAFAQGDAGNIDLSTSQLQVSNIASITSSTVGTGDGGNIKISSDFIELVGSRSDARSTISASSLGSGNAGSLTISTKQLRVEEGASLILPPM